MASALEWGSAQTFTVKKNEQRGWIAVAGSSTSEPLGSSDEAIAWLIANDPTDRS